MDDYTTHNKYHDVDKVGEDEVFMVSLVFGDAVILSLKSVGSRLLIEPVRFFFRCRHWIYQWNLLSPDRIPKAVEVTVSILTLYKRTISVWPIDTISELINETNLQLDFKYSTLEFERL